MPLTPSALAADVRSMCADFPQTATISRPGCKPYTIAAAVDMAGGGEALTDDGGARISTAYASAVVIAADCPWLPRIGDRVDIDGGDKWRVTSVRATPADPCITIDLEAWV